MASALTAEETIQLKVALHPISGVFWGKVYGAEADYIIAKSGASFFFAYPESGVRLKFQPLESPSFVPPADSTQNFTFTGNPDYEVAPSRPEDEAKGEERPAYLERDHLAYVVGCIDADTDITVKGKFVRNSLGEVRPNALFSKLDSSEATQLSSFHFVGSGGPTSNFKTLADVQPKGAWTALLNADQTKAIVRSNRWIGYEFQYWLGTNKTHRQYFGNGVENKDLPFMISG